jgi:hypothetical protein
MTTNETFLYNLEAKSAIEASLAHAVAQTTWNQACVVWLVGIEGIGKAALVKSWAVNAGAELFTIAPETHTSSKEVIDQIGKACNTLSFETTFSAIFAANKRPKVIVVDDIDIFASVDRSFFGNIADCLKESQSPKNVHKWRKAALVFVGSLAVEKRSRDVRKGVVMKLPEPTMSEVKQWLGNLQVKDSVLKEAGGNMAYLQVLIKNLPCIDAQNMCSQSNAMTEQHMDRHQGSEVMYDPRATWSDIRDVVQDDPWFHPMRFYENLPQEIEYRGGLVSAKLMSYRRTLLGLVDWDHLVASAEGNALEMASEFIVGLDRVHLGSLRRPKKAPPPAHTQSFTRLLSQLSLQKKHQRAEYEGRPVGW